MRFRFGIEHELALLRTDGRFADFSNTTQAELGAIINELPMFNGDSEQLHTDTLGLKNKRWYIEGFERFSPAGAYIRSDIKGAEIRTLIHESIDDAVKALRADYVIFKTQAAKHGFLPVGISLNPFQEGFEPKPLLNDWEIAYRDKPEDRTAFLHMMTYGPDISISLAGMASCQIIAAGRKLTFYSPYIVPFSFSSPFYLGCLWDGLSYRTYYRTGRRPAVLVYLPDKRDLIVSEPSLTQVARIPAEAGRIEYKALDTCTNADLYGSLLALIKGLVLDTSLPGRRTTPDVEMHKQAALRAWDDPQIYEGGAAILAAASRALTGDPDLHKLDTLWSMHAKKHTPAHTLIADYKKLKDITKVLARGYVL